MVNSNKPDIDNGHSSNAKFNYADYIGEHENEIDSISSEANNEIGVQYKAEGNRESTIERVKFKGLDYDIMRSEKSVDKKLPPIPDGGWGWVVVASAFLVLACADGLVFSFGPLHAEFERSFKSSYSETIVVNWIFIYIRFFVGPIMSALVDRYGCRIMTIIAGILSTIGFLLAAISNSIAMLSVTLGFISGLAIGILYVTAVVSVVFWFDKRRNLAVSLASCGIGFGPFIYSPLSNYFLKECDWRNTLVLLSCTLLNICVCGALMRNPEWLEIKQKRQRRLSNDRSRKFSRAGCVSSRSPAGKSVYLGEEEFKSLLNSNHSPEIILATLVSSIVEAKELNEKTQMNSEQPYKRINSVIQLPTFVKQNEEVPPEVIEKLMGNKCLYNNVLQNYPDFITPNRSESSLNVEISSINSSNEAAHLQVGIDNVVTKNQLRTNVNRTEWNENFQKRKDETGHSSPKVISNHDPTTNGKRSGAVPAVQNRVEEISKDHHYLRDMALYKNSIKHGGAIITNSRCRVRATSLPEMHRNSRWSLQAESDREMASSLSIKNWYSRSLETFKSAFDLKIFTEFHFLMFNLSYLIFSIWYLVPHYLLKLYMTYSGIEDGGRIITIVDIVSRIGIVALGWAGDQPWMSVTKMTACCFVVCGLCVASYPLIFTTYWTSYQTCYGTLVAVSAIYGLSFASYYSYTPSILVELLPVDHFTYAYGVILLNRGIGNFIEPVVEGLLYDATDSFELIFYVAGLWLVVSGMCVGVLALTKNKRLCGNKPLLKESEEAKSEPGVEAAPV